MTTADQSPTNEEYPPLTTDDTHAQLEQRLQRAESELAALKADRKIAWDRMDEVVNYRSAFDILITNIYSKFIHYAPHEIDEGICQALADIADFASVDHSYIILVSEASSEQAYEWCAPNIPSQRDAIQSLSINALSWWMDQLRQHESVYVPRVEDMPDIAQQEKTYLKSRGVQSVMIVPLYQHHKLVGLLGFNSIQQERRWEKEDIHLLRVVADIFAQALRRKTAAEHEKKAYELGHQLVTLIDVPDLLAHTVQALRDTFDYYHAQVFLSNHFYNGDTAVSPDESVQLIVQEATGPVGSQIKASGHTIPLNAEKSLVARAARSLDLVVVNDVKESTDHLPNPLLPATQSEAAVPLVAEERLLGVLDLQHTEVNHFIPNETRILQIIARQLSVALAKAALFTKNQRLLDEKTVLHAVASACAAATDEDILFEQVTGIIGQTLYPDNFGILLKDAAGEYLSTHSSYHGQPVTIKIGDSVSSLVLRNGRAQRIPDVTKVDNYIPSGPGMRSELCVPFQVGSEIIGVLDAESKKINAFSEADEIMLTTIAHQLGSGIERLRLFKREQQQAVKQQLLAEKAGEMLSANSTQELWPQLAEAAAELLSADRVGIYLYDEQNKSLSCPFAHKLSPTYVQALIEHFMDAPGAKGLVQTEPIVIDDATVHPETGNLREVMIQEGFRSYVAFTLHAPRSPIGSLVLYRDQVRPFTKDDLDLGQTLAHFIAVAFHNIQLLAETNLALMREQQLNEITRAMSISTDLPALMANVVRMAAELVNADAGLIGLVIDNQVITYYPYNIPRKISLTPTPKGRGTGWYLVETGFPYIQTNYEDHPQANLSWPRAGVRAAIGVPIATGDTPIGSLELLSLTPSKQFTRRDLALAESVGRQAGVSIQNIRHYAEARQRVGTLAATLAKQEELDQLKNQFIQNVSHELRTPLGIILGHSELLHMGRMGELTEEQKHSTEIISRRVRMMTRLVEDLKALLAAETQEFRRDEINLAQMMQSMLADFKMKANEVGVTLASDIQEDVPVVMGDSTHLRRVFDNLMSNAFKFTPEGGAITLRMWRDSKDVVMEVSDSGVGIPEEKMGRIFERFYQVDGSVRRRYEGTGLGLALVKEIVEAHRGKVTVHSEVGLGTTFRIRLPGFSL